MKVFSYLTILVFLMALMPMGAWADSDPTANMDFALTTPAPDGGNTISVDQAASPKTVEVGVVNGTNSVVITGTKTAAQSVAVAGANAALVTAGGTETAPT